MEEYNDYLKFFNFGNFDNSVLYSKFGIYSTDTVSNKVGQHYKYMYRNTQRG